MRAVGKKELVSGEAAWNHDRSREMRASCVHRHFLGFEGQAKGQKSMGMWTVVAYLKAASHRRTKALAGAWRRRPGCGREMAGSLQMQVPNLPSLRCRSFDAAAGGDGGGSVQRASLGPTSTSTLARNIVVARRVEEGVTPMQ